MIQVLAHEPKGDVLRTLRQLGSDPAEAAFVWGKLKQCRHHLAEKDSHLPETLREMIEHREKFWLIDNVGVLMFDPWLAGHAHTHVTLWDGRLRGREEMAVTVLSLLATQHVVHTIWTMIPDSPSAVLAFARRCGFRELPQKMNGMLVLFLHPGDCTTQKRGTH